MASESSSQQDGSGEALARDPIAIQYRTEKTRPRDDLFGKFFRLLSDHPLIAGLLGGICGVLIAWANAPGAFSNAPGPASVLSAGVILVWVALLYVMRPFFEQQTEEVLEIVRLLTYDGREFVWMEGDRNLKAISEPTFRLYADRVPESISDSEKALEQPWPAWVEVTSDDTTFLLETRVTAEEAMSYPEPEASLRDDPDEKLPAHVASPLLVLARHGSKTSGEGGSPEAKK